MVADARHARWSTKQVGSLAENEIKSVLAWTHKPPFTSRSHLLHYSSQKIKRKGHWKHRLHQIIQEWCAKSADSQPKNSSLKISFQVRVLQNHFVLSRVQAVSHIDPYRRPSKARDHLLSDMYVRTGYLRNCLIPKMHRGKLSYSKTYRLNVGISGFPPKGLETLYEIIPQQHERNVGANRRCQLSQLHD